MAIRILSSENISGEVLIASGKYLSWGTAGATSIEGSTVSNKLQFRTNSTNAVIIDSSQNVGIGTILPASVLHIKDNSSGPTQLSLQSNDFTRAEEINFLNPSTAAISGQIKYYTNPTVEYMSFSISNNSAAVERMRIANTLITYPTVTELRGDIGNNKFAIGNMGDASSQMMVSSRGFLTFNVSNTGSALDATERVRIEDTGVMKFANTATSTGDVGTIAHYTNNFMYIRGGTGGLAIGDDGFDVSMYLNNNDSMSLNTAGVQRMRINSQGQMWLGGSYTGSDIANGNTGYMNNLNAGSFSILHRNSSDVYVHFNSYYTNSNTYVSKYSGRGFMLGYNAAADNGFFFSKAPNTTAGQNQTFSQVMTVGYGTSNNVGIGTTNPAAKLEIDIGVDEVGLGVFTTGESTTPNVRFGRDDAQYIGFQVQDRTNTIVFRQDEGTGEHSADLDLWTSTNGDKYFRINNNDQSGNLISNWLTIKNGNVGIGVTGPSAKLDVAGIIRSKGSNNYENILTKEGSTGSFTFTQTELNAGIVDNISYFIFVSVYRPTTDVANDVGTLLLHGIMPRVGNSIFNTINTLKGPGIAVLTATNSGNSLVITTDSNVNLRCAIKLISIGGTS